MQSAQTSETGHDAPSGGPRSIRVGAVMTASAPVKLNIGAGQTVIDGFAPIDRRLGSEAYPLTQYADNSVDEIRASHILEHFSFREVRPVLAEWVRGLKPGGRIRSAVPDFDWICAHSNDPLATFYLMGGQIDENDFHKSVFRHRGLEELMRAVGLINVRPWTSTNTDCATLAGSLNLEGEKRAKYDNWK